MPAEELLYTDKTHTTGGRPERVGALERRPPTSGSRCPADRAPAPIPSSCWTTGWSACFASAMRLEICTMKFALPNDLAITAEADLNLGGDGYFLRARLNVSLPGIEPEIAKALIDGAHQTCPYSKATRGNIEVAITLI